MNMIVLLYFGIVFYWNMLLLVLINLRWVSKSEWNVLALNSYILNICQFQSGGTSPQSPNKRTVNFTISPKHSTPPISIQQNVPKLETPAAEDETDNKETSNAAGGTDFAPSIIIEEEDGRDDDGVKDEDQDEGSNRKRDESDGKTSWKVLDVIW